jgi:hypothetical protein
MLCKQSLRHLYFFLVQVTVSVDSLLDDLPVPKIAAPSEINARSSADTNHSPEDFDILGR